MLVSKFYPQIWEAPIIDAIAETAVLPVDGYTMVAFGIKSGTTFSTAGFTFEASINSTNGSNGDWFPIQGIRTSDNTLMSTSGNLSAAPAYIWQFNVANLNWIRARCTAIASGTVIFQAQRTHEGVMPQYAGATTVSGAVTLSGSVNNVIDTPVASLVYRLNSLATTNLQFIKASSTRLFSVQASNNAGTAAFVKLYNKASAPVVASDTPALIIPIPAASVINLDLGPLGSLFATGLSHAITNLIADTDATAVALGQVKLTANYL